MQSDDSIIFIFYFIVFIENMLAEKKLLDYISLSSLNDHKENDKIINMYFKGKMAKENPILEFR